MGMLQAGKWVEEDHIIVDGAYVRQSSVFKGRIDAETLQAMADRPGRFHFITSPSCPWSYRATLIRRLKGLESTIPIHLTGWRRVQGYPVNSGLPWTVPGDGRAIVHLHQLYTLADAQYTGRVTVPVLWDSERRTIVSNESAEIMRAFDALDGDTAATAMTFLPPAHRDAIDAWNEKTYHGLCNAVYRAGFAASESAYNDAVTHITRMLATLEQHLADHRFLLGSVVTEADIRLFATLVRFDICYYNLFRCCDRPLCDYPNLWAYTRDIYNWRGVSQTIDFGAIFASALENDVRDRSRVDTTCPELAWDTAHDRASLGPVMVSTRTDELIPFEQVYSYAA